MLQDSEIEVGPFTTGAASVGVGGNGISWIVRVADEVPSL